ncbi:YggT family protein [Gorillibacterium massiliense]|uniref:YggT family protein n=1 Tax=Gorillibacterium massiliense TaxID=1280390 RepID=UPI000593E7DC|nr:YggT family protein [Gorillibacterium massiliense]
MENIVHTLLFYLYELYYVAMFVYILMSWLPNVRESSFGRGLAKVVEPYLSPFRKIIPPIGGMLDISPILALFAFRYVYWGIDAVVDFIFKWLNKAF